MKLDIFVDYVGEVDSTDKSTDPQNVWFIKFKKLQISLSLKRIH